MARETFLGTQKCFTDGKHELSSGEWIETHRKKQDMIDISGTGHQMEPWKKLVLRRIEQFGKNPQKSQRRWEISESIF